jgi:hypothetical protein
VSKDSTSIRKGVGFVVLLGVLLSIVYGKTEAGPFRSPVESEAHAAQTPPQSAAELPVTFERHTGDLDAMVKRGSIRALVFYSRSGFFYVNGRPEGIYFEALKSFEQFVNRKLHTRQHVQVIPSTASSAMALLADWVAEAFEVPPRATTYRTLSAATLRPLNLKAPLSSVLLWATCTGAPALAAYRVTVDPTIGRFAP